MHVACIYSRMCNYWTHSMRTWEREDESNVAPGTITQRYKGQIYQFFQRGERKGRENEREGREKRRGKIEERREEEKRREENEERKHGIRNSGLVFLLFLIRRGYVRGLLSHCSFRWICKGGLSLLFPQVDGTCRPECLLPRWEDKRSLCPLFPWTGFDSLLWVSWCTPSVTWLDSTEVPFVY